MRRTTIFPSKAPVVVVAAAIAVANAPLMAQDTTTVTGDRVHVVAIGETLWTLAELYFGDPHLWPQIYRLNTLVVEDPHWIFPGEELLLVDPPPPSPGTDPGTDDPPPPIPGTGGPDVVAQATEVVAPPPPPPPPPNAEPTVFAKSAARSGLGVVRPAPPRGSGEMRFHAAGFLTEEEDLPWGEVLGAVDRSTLSTLRATSSATVFENVRIRAPENATYGVGDSLLVARLSRVVPDWGRVVVPAGIVRVIDVDGRSVRAEITVQFERIADGQVALPLPAFLGVGTARAVPVEDGLRGSIIAPRDLHPVPTLRNIVFLDRGRVDGVAAGDLYEVLAPSLERDAPPSRRVALVEVVHVRERSASVVISAIYDIGVRAGAPVRLIRKMP